MTRWLLLWFSSFLNFERSYPLFWWLGFFRWHGLSLAPMKCHHPKLRCPWQPSRSSFQLFQPFHLWVEFTMELRHPNFHLWAHPQSKWIHQRWIQAIQAFQSIQAIRHVPSCYHRMFQVFLQLLPLCQRHRLKNRWPRSRWKDWRCVWKRWRCDTWMLFICFMSTSYDFFWTKTATSNLQLWKCVLTTWVLRWKNWTKKAKKAQMDNWKVKTWKQKLKRWKCLRRFDDIFGSRNLVDWSILI